MEGSTQTVFHTTEHSEELRADAAVPNKPGGQWVQVKSGYSTLSKDPSTTDSVKLHLPSRRVVTISQIVRGSGHRASEKCFILSAAVEAFATDVVAMPVVFRDHDGTETLYLRVRNGKGHVFQVTPEEMFRGDGEVKGEIEAAMSPSVTEQIFGASYAREIDYTLLEGELPADKKAHLPDTVRSLSVCIASRELAEGEEAPATLRGDGFKAINITSACARLARGETVESRVDAFFAASRDDVADTQENRAIITKLVATRVSQAVHPAWARIRTLVPERVARVAHYLPTRREVLFLTAGVVVTYVLGYIFAGDPEKFISMVYPNATCSLPYKG